MLTIYRSNRSEWLAKILSEELKVAPPQISDKVKILVSTWPTSKWLGDQLAIVNGINSQIDFPFPGTYLRKLINQILDKKANKDDLWKPSKLVWPILNLIPEITIKKEGAPLREWIENRSCREGEVNKDIWQLARSIADVFDDYILYRPELTYQWCKSKDHEFKRLVGRLSSEI